MKDGNSKKLIIIIAACVVVVVAIIGTIFALGIKKEPAYRIIKVYKLEGEAKVDRASLGEIDIYENMVLESGDTIKVGEGRLTLVLDADKYVYAEANTEFSVEATGTAADSKTTINLLEGSITNDIQNKLSDESYYEINTPNATMSVRGTVYYVSTYIGEDGIRYSKISVFDGTVAADRILPNGTAQGDNTMIQHGNEVIIYYDGNITDYVDGGIREINYDELPVETLKTIVKIAKENALNVVFPETVTKRIEESESDDLIGTGEDDENSDKEALDDESKKEEDDEEVVETDDQPTEKTPSTESKTGKKTSSKTTTKNTTSKTPSDNGSTNEVTDSGTYTVTFMYNGSVFGTQTVKSGEKATTPSLQPTASGKWNHDFSKAVTGDLIIEWE